MFVRKLMSVGCIVVLLCLAVPAVTHAAIPGTTLDVLFAQAYVPSPNLRIMATGILGSDGTRFDSTTVSAKLPEDKLVTQATTELTYIEYKNKVIDASADRNVIRYSDEADGIYRRALVSKRSEENVLWLPQNIEIGTQWKSSWGSRREIMEQGVTVETPAGRFEGCIVVEYDVYAAAVGIFRHYIAPGVGLIKTVALRGPKSTSGSTWYEVQRVEKIDSTQARQAVEQMLGR